MRRRPAIIRTNNVELQCCYYLRTYCYQMITYDTAVIIKFVNWRANTTVFWKKHRDFETTNVGGGRLGPVVENTVTGGTGSGRQMRGLIACRICTLDTTRWWCLVVKRSCSRTRISYFRSSEDRQFCRRCLSDVRQ